MVIVPHSEGVLNVADTLAKRPNVAAFTHVWLPVQGPYQGSAVVSALSNDSDCCNRCGRSGGPILGVEPGTDSEMSYPYRQAQNASHRLSHIATVVVSTTHAGRWSELSAFSATGKYLRLSYGVGSDGIVAEHETHMAGAGRIHLHGTDHMGQ